MNRLQTTVPTGRILLTILFVAGLVAVFGLSAFATGPKDPGTSDSRYPHAGDEQVPGNMRPYVPGELIIKLVGDPVSVDSINALYGTTTEQYFDRLDIFILLADEDADVEAMAAEIELLNGVVFAHPNYAVNPLQSVQGSFPFSDQNFIGSFSDQEPAQRLRLAAAQAVSTGQGVRVGVIDGGVNYSHPELSGAVVSGWDFIDNDPNAYDEPGGSNSGHGTFVAGVIHLVAPDAEIYAYRVADTSGASDGDRVAEAILQAVDDGCRVINLSLVMVEEHEVLRNALVYARNNNVLVVTAAGNGLTEEAAYPAIDPNVLAVAAVDSNDQLAEFSRYGHHIDVSAPGDWVYSTYQDTIFAWWSGTSFAAPFVAGSAALKLAQAGTTMSWSELHAFMTGTAENIDAANPGYENLLGAGLINPVAALADTVDIDSAWISPATFAYEMAAGDSDSVEACVNLSAANPGAVFVATVLSGGGGFVDLTDSIGYPGETICFDVSASGLSAGQYVDTIMFDVSGVSNSPLIAIVYLTVTDGPVEGMTIDPTSISVTVPENGAPVQQCTYLSSTNAPASYTAYPADSASFLTIDNSSGMTNADVCVTLDPSGLAPGTYTSGVFYSVEGVTSQLFQPVTMTVGDGGGGDTTVPQGALSPDTIFVEVPWGTTDTIVECSYLLGDDTATYTAVGGYLSTPVETSGFTPDSVCVSIETWKAEGASLYIDTVAYFVGGSTEPVVLTIWLKILKPATFSPPELNFTAEEGSTTPMTGFSYLFQYNQPPRNYTGEVLGGGLFTTLLDTSGTTPDSVHVEVDPSGLAAGMYTDTVVCSIEGTLESAVLPVHLEITDGGSGGPADTAYVAPPSFSYTVSADAPTLTDAFFLGSTNAPSSYFIESSFFMASWLSIPDSLGSTNDTVQFAVDPSLAPGAGTFIDTIRCHVDGVDNVPIVTVALTITDDTTGGGGGDSAFAAPNSLDFYASSYSGAPVQAGTFTLYSANAPAAYTVEALTGAAWLTVVDSVGMTNDSVRVTVDPTLAPGFGTFIDTLLCTVEGVGVEPIVTVSLTIAQDTTGGGGGDSAFAAPDHFQFVSSSYFGAPIQAGVFTLYSANAPAAYTVEALSGAAWLTVVDSVGVTNDSVRFTVDPTLAPGTGTFADTLLCTVQGVSSTPLVTVSLTITDDTTTAGDSAFFLPNYLSFTAPEGADVVMTDCALLTSTNAPANYSLASGPTASWLTALASSGVTGDSICVEVNPSGLASGMYIDTIFYDVEGVADPAYLAVYLTVDTVQGITAQNYPNPFNPETEIAFSLSSASQVTVVVYNTLGQEVKTLVDEFLTSGEHHVSWNGTNRRGQSVASGVYFYRISSETQVVTRKMLLLR